MTFDQFLRILRARWKLAAGIFVAAVLITVIATLVFPKKYQASTTVLLDSRPDPVSAQSMNTLSAMSFLMTQIDVIESPAVAQRVVRLLRLDENPTLRSQWAEETEQRGDYIAWLGDLMSKGLKVKPSRESNVIEISYEGADPTFTAAMANAFAQAFIETTVQFKPRDQWRAGMTPEKLIEELDRAVKVPGLSNIWVPPIRNRIDMLATGIKSPIGVKVSGTSLVDIERITRDIEAVAKEVPGVSSALAERLTGGRYVDIQIDRLAAARYGLSIADVQAVVSGAIGGSNIGETVEGLARFPISLRYPREWRDSPEALRRMPILTPAGQQITLGTVAQAFSAPSRNSGLS